jgi:hypothetical protein
MLKSKTAQMTFRPAEFAGLVLLLLFSSCRGDHSSGSAFVAHPSTRTAGLSTPFGSMNTYVIPTSATAYMASSVWKSQSSFDWSLSATKKKQKPEEGTKGRKKNNHAKWQPFYEALAKYHQQHGHCNVSLEEDELLYEWLAEQRTSYKNLQLGRKTKLTRKRAVALEMVEAIPAELLDL